ncbi:MAG: class I SAM-dependent methyltransferase [Candidatus Promineifilaceae bacterium]|nr:class I SAM-dependent methyltransferase [Candidatus Promineifilaceae bacterium]
MLSLFPLLLLLLFSILLATFLYWLLVTTEGVFLGRRMVVWLYDLTAHKYDAIKEYDPDDERLLVARPVMHAVRHLSQPLILDVATGTGRVPVDLLREPAFRGRLLALDAAPRMLAVARRRLAPYSGRVQLVQHPAVPLPFADLTFDAVTCLEALEFFPSDRAALQEMVRVLKPGGVLLTTRRCGAEARAFLHRYRSPHSLHALLRDAGLEGIEIFLWQVNYDLVRAWKPETA